MAEILTQQAHDVGTQGIDSIASSSRFDGWYCIKLKPGWCSCGTEHLHCGTPPRIIVWPEIDHEELLDTAIVYRDAGDDARIVEYERSLGLAIPHDNPEAQSWLYD